MAADKFNCPKCSVESAVVSTVVGRNKITRYRWCRICKVHFSTCEAVQDTPRMRQFVGPEKAAILWPIAPFKYRNPSVPRAGKKWDKSKA